MVFLGVLWPLVKTFWKPIAVIVVVFAVYGYAYHSGKVKERGIWVAKIEAERKAQNIIIRAREAAAIKDLETLREEVEMQNAQINELLSEADTDANAKRPALGVDGVRRINRSSARRP